MEPVTYLAGLLLVAEAGGLVRDADGGEAVLESGTICAGSQDIQPLLADRLRAAN